MTMMYEVSYLSLCFIEYDIHGLQLDHGLVYLQCQLLRNLMWHFGIFNAGTYIRDAFQYMLTSFDIS